MITPPTPATNALDTAAPTAPVGDITKRGTLVAMILASGIAFLDGAVINVALPAIGRDLRVGLSGLQWIVDGYALTLASLLIVGGSLGDHFGRRRIILAGLIGFGVASSWCLGHSSAGRLWIMLRGGGSSLSICR